jgi:hypothetical protein
MNGRLAVGRPMTFSKLAAAVHASKLNEKVELLQQSSTEKDDRARFLFSTLLKLGKRTIVSQLPCFLLTTETLPRIPLLVGFLGLHSTLRDTFFRDTFFPRRIRLHGGRKLSASFAIYYHAKVDHL